PRISSRPAAVRPIIREAGHMRAASRVQKDQKKGLTEGVSTYVSRGSRRRGKFGDERLCANRVAVRTGIKSNHFGGVGPERLQQYVTSTNGTSAQVKGGIVLNAAEPAA
ncbi:hypothetical protein, partial [Agrobacterium vitis]|uniref:hypothetical protein n=1 Tax=Agrobacterium vitis TaxID=373 RepID=UPI001F43457C